jgi:hypothetical protein
MEMKKRMKNEESKEMTASEFQSPFTDLWYTMSVPLSSTALVTDSLECSELHEATQIVTFRVWF